jgi:hypothetical protein
MAVRAASILALVASFSVACGDDDRGSWQRLAPMPTPRVGVAVAALDHEIFVIGGLEANGSVSDKVEIYDTQADTWREGPPLYEPRHGAAVVEFDGRVWVIGGFAGPGFDQPKDTVWAITPDGRMARKGRLNVARGGLAATGDGGQPVAIGGATVGTDGDARSLRYMELYDYAGDAWFETDETVLNVPRDHLAAAVMTRGCNDVCVQYTYIVGGRCNMDEACNLNTNESCIHGLCTLAAPMPTARSGIAVVAFGPNLAQRIYVFGGGIPSEGSLNTNEMYDPETDRWHAMAPMPSARHGLGAAVVGDTIYVIGGSQQPGFVTGANEAYTPPE